MSGKDLSGYTYLWFMNGWTEENQPAIYKKHKKENHTEREVTLRCCLHRYICDKCKFYYDVDSSD